MSGNGEVRALDALPSIEPLPAASTDVLNGTILTRLEVLLQPNATVAQLNSAGTAVGATRFAFSEANSPWLTLEVPRQSTVASLNALAATLGTQPGIAFAWPAREFRASVLPEASPGVPVQSSELSQLLASRFPAAWNARSAGPQDCEPNPVEVVVWDRFGSWSPPGFFEQFGSNAFLGDPEGSSAPSDGHGFEVSEVLAAQLDAKQPTGANPFAGCAQLRQSDVMGLAMNESVHKLARTVRGDSRLIVNASINFVDPLCGPNADTLCDAATVASTDPALLRGALVERVVTASEWAKTAASDQITERVLIAQAAGNVDPEPNSYLARNYLGFRIAAFSSAPVLATHVGEIDKLLTDPALWKSPDPALPDLTFDPEAATAIVALLRSIGVPEDGVSAANLLVVDSGTAAATLDEVHQSDFDFLGADVRAVGQAVAVGNKPRDGTSFSAPQAAGLASLLWLFSDPLRSGPAADTAALVKATSRATANSPTVPVMDAYAAVLALDHPGSLGIRAALLDANADRHFDHLDLTAFIDAYDAADASPPVAADYGRFDLNGDGVTGGPQTHAFDLDADGSSAPHEIDEDVDGFTVSFNEAALSDHEILCYYAYSDLYAASGANQAEALAARTSLLGAERCAGVRMTLALTGRIDEGSAGALTLALERPTLGGNYEAVANAPYSLTVTGGTASPSSGTTDGAGRATATVMPGSGVTKVEVQAVARSSTGSVLARGSATATVVSAGEGHYEGSYTRTCSLFGRPATVTTFAATFDLKASGEQALGGTLTGPEDPLLQFGGQFILSGPLTDFEGFRDVGSFTWTLTGHTVGNAVHLDVEEIGLGCTLSFDGSIAP